jgi:type VI secretion system secreted protein VgrG
VHGIVRRVEHGEHGKFQTAYRITVAPAAYRLALRRDQRIFQELSVPDIVKQVMTEAGLDAPRLALQGSYSPREYCVQYHETDWNFVCRLLESEGIAFYFEQSESGHLMVLVDAPEGFAPIAGQAQVVFRPPADALVSGEHIHAFRFAVDLRSGKVTLRDYDFHRPNLTLEGAFQGSVHTDLELYDYPGDFQAPPAGSALATVRQGEEDTPRKLGDGTGNCPRLAAGCTFELADHPADDLNARYLLTRVFHRGNDPLMFSGAESEPAYENEFEAIPANVPYRPTRLAFHPRIYGIQTAKVVGPAGEEIHVDEHGRIKVQFHWDRKGKNDEHSSCWMRVAQAWAGTAWGAMFIPRIGHEVVVSFLEGDPDRPLVTGSVYHGVNVPPYALPADKTKSTVKSNSSPGGGGFNELRFEDRKGSEEVFLHAEKDWTIEVKHDKSQHVGRDETLAVDRNRQATVGVNEIEKVGVDRTVNIGANHTEVVGANLTLTVGGAIGMTVGGAMAVTLGGAFTQAVGGPMELQVAKGKQESVGESSSQSVGGNQAVSVAGSQSLEVEKSSSTRVGEDSSELVEGSKNLDVGKTYTLKCGEGTVTVQSNGDILIQGKEIQVKGSGPIRVEGSKLEVKSQGTVDVTASGTVKVKGSAVEVN